MEQEQEKKYDGALFGSVVIIVILIIGGIYVLYNKYQEMKQMEQNASQGQTLLDQNQ